MTTSPCLTSQVVTIRIRINQFIGVTSFLPGEGLKCAGARRAEAAGDSVPGKGCPLSLGKKIFEF